MKQPAGTGDTGDGTFGHANAGFLPDRLMARRIKRLTKRADFRQAL